MDRFRILFIVKTGTKSHEPQAPQNLDLLLPDPFDLESSHLDPFNGLRLILVFLSSLFSDSMAQKCMLPSLPVAYIESQSGGFARLWEPPAFLC